MKWIATVNSKGGVAKTTTALTLARYLQLQDKSVVLVDDDRNRSLLKWEARSEDPLFPVLSFEDMEQAQDYDYGILDTAASLSDETVKDVCSFADLIIIPCKPDIDSLSGTTETADTVIEHDGNYAILLCDCPGASKRENKEIAEVIEDGEYILLSQTVRRSAGIKRASLAGKTLDQMTGAYRLAWHDYRKAFAEMMEFM